MVAGVVVPLGAGALCGNRILDPGETCDPPEPDSSALDRCRSDCRFCGDGTPDFAFEACDDGNNVSGDGCEADCHILRYVAVDGNDTTGDGTSGNPYRTIQRAFEQAGSYFTIMVGPGTYAECVTAAPPVAADRPVKIVAQAWVDDRDNAATTITGDGICDVDQAVGDRAPAVRVSSRGSRVEGFTVTRGGASGILAAGNVVITNNVITGNGSTVGGGIYLDVTNTGFGAIQAEISHNQVTGNRATGNGGGVFVSAVGVTDDVNVVVDDNTIQNNSIGRPAVAGDVHGGGLGVLTNSDAGAEVRVAVTNNLIAGNRVEAGISGYGGGAWVSTFGYGMETIDVGGNTIEGNTAVLDGGGLSAWISTAGTRADTDPLTPDSDVRHTINVTENVVRNNLSDNGGGLDLFLFAQNLKDDERAQIDVARNLVEQNTSFGGGGGFGAGGGGAQIALTSWRSETPDTWIRLEDNVIQSNAAGVSGGGIAVVAEADANPPGDDSDPRPAPAPAAARVDVVRNLIVSNDASTPFAAGGGVFAYVKAFVDANTALNVDRSTVSGNLADDFAGGIHVETFTADDSPPTGGVFTTELNVSNSIITGNDLVGIGGPVPGSELGILSPGGDFGDTGNLDINVAYSDAFGNPAGNYDNWIPDPTGQNGNIFADPMFDESWRESPCSRTIDAADPALDFSLEPPPNGGRANMGSTGGTPQAVSSLPDLSGDDIIDGIDILQLSVAFGSTLGAPRYDALADFNGDGFVDGPDLSVLAADFGEGCP